MSSALRFLLAAALLFSAAEAGTSVNRAAGSLRRREDPPSAKEKTYDLSPELHPTSDKEFFGKDYPDDVHPKVDKDLHKFSPPYPLVQDESQFDKDFVKDENSDGGEWKSQMAYDELRHKVLEEQNQVKTAMDKRDGVQKDLSEAEANEKAAEEDAKKAEGEAKEARNKLEDAHDEVDKIKAKAGTGDNHEILNATKKVEDEVNDLEECRKQLQEAKDRLEKLLEEKKAADKEMAAELADDIKKAEAAVKDAQDKKDVAEAAQKEKEKSEAAAEKKLNEEQTEFDAASADLEKEQAEAEKAEKELAKATERLRKDRYSKGGEGGGGIAPGDGSSTDESGPAGLKRSAATPSSLPLWSPLVTLALGMGITFAF